MSTPDPLITAADTVDGNISAGGVTQTLLEALKARTSRVIQVTEALGDFDFSTGEPPYSVIYAATGYLYFYQADDTTTADDGLTCLVSADGKRYQIADSSALAISSVLAMQNAPPGSPAVNDAYVVDVAPTGAWVGHAKDIALYTKRGWVFGQPKPGDALLNETTGLNIQYSAAGSWGSMATSITSGGVAPGQLLFPMGLSVEAQQNAPPGSPVAGDGLYYLVGLSPTGAWSGKANKIAYYTAASAWAFIDAYGGATVYNKSSAAAMTYNASSGVWAPPFPLAATCQARISVQTGTPVPTTDQTAQATLYLTRDGGDSIALYVNGGWALRTVPAAGSEASLSIAGYTASKPYDIFAYDNAGVPALESLVWTNDSTRATALALQDGIWVKSGDPTRRHVATIYTTATGQTEDSAKKRYVWNRYNRRSRNIGFVANTTGWSNTSSTIRQANSSTYFQSEFIVGDSTDAVTAALRVTGSSTGTAMFSVSMALDSTSTPATGQVQTMAGGVVGVVASLSADWSGMVAAGRHYLAWLETGITGQTTSFYGTTTGSGMTGRISA